MWVNQLSKLSTSLCRTKNVKKMKALKGFVCKISMHWRRIQSNHETQDHSWIHISWTRILFLMLIKLLTIYVMRYFNTLYFLKMCPQYCTFVFQYADFFLYVCGHMQCNFLSPQSYFSSHFLFGHILNGRGQVDKLLSGLFQPLNCKSVCLRNQQLIPLTKKCNKKKYICDWLLPFCTIVSHKWTNCPLTMMNHSQQLTYEMGRQASFADIIRHRRVKDGFQVCGSSL